MITINPFRAFSIAGVGKYLKEKNPDVKIVLSDPQGSGLYHKVSLRIGPLWNVSHSEYELLDPRWCDVFKYRGGRKTKTTPNGYSK